MTAGEIAGWVGAAVAGAAILAYVGWQVWRAVKRKPIVVTVARSEDGMVFAHSDVGPELLTVLFKDDAGKPHETVRHYWYPEILGHVELSISATPNATRPSKTGR